MNIGIVGEKGESMVARFLQQQGFTVLKRNYQCRYGEIDIIAQNNQFILFVEVKTRKADSLVPIENAVDIRKRKRLILTAEDYLSKTECELQPRFDVALVTVNENPEEGSGYSLNYIKNAF